MIILWGLFEYYISFSSSSHRKTSRLVREYHNANQKIVLFFSCTKKKKLFLLLQIIADLVNGNKNRSLNEQNTITLKFL